MGVTRAAGHEEHRGDDRQRHECRAHPLRLRHHDESAEDFAFHFHNWVFLLFFCFCCFRERRVRKFTALLVGPGSRKAIRHGSGNARSHGRKGTVVALSVSV